MKVSYLQAGLLTLALFVAPGGAPVLAEETPPGMVLAQEEPKPDAGQGQQTQQDCDPQDETCQPQKQRNKKKHGGDQQDQNQQQPPQDVQQDQPSDSEQTQQHKWKKKHGEAQQAPEPDQPSQPETTQQPEAQQYQQEEPSQQPQVQRRKQQGEAQPQVESGQPTPATDNDAAAAFLQSVRPASELSEDELRRQMHRAVELSKAKGLSQDQRQALRDVIREGRATLKAKARMENPPPPASTATPEGQQVEQPPVRKPQPQEMQQGAGQQQEQGGQPQQRVNPALESEAQALLNDTVDVRTLNRRELRQRLSGMRDLLASGQLSPHTKDALRQKLAQERQVLRSEVSAEEEGGDQRRWGTGGNAGNPPPPPRHGKNNHGSGGFNLDLNIVLGDTRPPDDLGDDELVRRIDVYRVAVDDRRYSQIERERWRRQMERDRMFLRQRMLEERRQREARLRSGDVEFNIVIEDRYVPGRRPPPPSVFAAEVEDQELADVLAAPPRRQIDRRYTVEEIEQSPQARDAVARIEIDTVHFGFGESFLREEEIDKLDRIARILERILAEHPDEVFLLEGHTDAVGTDEANLQLSRERAKAVKEALVTYYVIPAQNLKTVGLGERYLKIPTNEPEAENRRVSLARITPLVGEAQ